MSTQHSTDTLRVFSFGGGWQSMAAMVLAAQGVLDYQLFLFANVGDDSEHPGTLAYFHQHAVPFAEAHGIELVQLRKVVKATGQERTLFQDLTRPGDQTPNIPLRAANGAPGARSCTSNWKIRVIRAELKRRGASPASPAAVGIGISLDEIGRANDRRAESFENIEYPLLDLRIRRADCPDIITAAGLPVPPRSACWFCPLKRPTAWTAMRADEPELFARACALEAHLNRRRDAAGKPHLFLTRFAKPLDQAIGHDTPLLSLGEDDEADGACDSGHCFT